MAIVCGLSGGVDSTLSICLLQEKGEDVIGVTMRLWTECDNGRSGCCGTEEHRSVKLISNDKGFPYYLYTLSEQFKTKVVDDYIASFGRGETPMPCTHCNTDFKWGYLQSFAERLGANKVATGHYARKEKYFDHWILKTAADLNKDQTFFLWGLNQKQLESAEFPVGHLTKDQVREESRIRGLSTANKKESMDVCFIPDSSKEFLKRHIPQAFVPGNLVDVNGKIVGKHDGIGNYTVGMRKGLGSSGPEPRYVISIDHKTNDVIVGPREYLFTDEISLRDINWFLGEPPKEMWVRVRHRGELVRAEIDGNTVKTDQKLIKPAKGQTLVAYSSVLDDGSRYCFGGGWVI